MQGFPTWVVYAVGIASVIQIFSGLVLVALGVSGIGILLQIKAVIAEEFRKDLLPSLSGTLKNVESTTADVAKNSRDVTISINRSEKG